MLATPAGSAAALSSEAAANTWGLAKMGDDEMIYDVGRATSSTVPSRSSRMASSRRKRRLMTIFNRGGFRQRHIGRPHAGVQAEQLTVGIGWKPSGHPPSERCKNAPSTLHLFPRSQPSRSTLSLTKMSFVSFSMSKNRFVVLTASCSIWFCLQSGFLSESLTSGLVPKGTVQGGC